MPEGHTLHRLARSQNRRFRGSTLAVSSPQGRFVDGAAAVDGLVLQRAWAHGKHLFHDYRHGAVVHVHLGLYGTFAEHPKPLAPPRGQVRMRIEGPQHWADLRGPTRCELLTPEQVSTILDRLGPDPLRSTADPQAAWRRIRRSRALIATLLIDQSVLAGVGNVYRAEVLFRQGIAPHRVGNAISQEQWSRIWEDLVALMRAGARSGRIDTVRPQHDPRLLGGQARQDRHGGEVYVYRRTGLPCLVCGNPVASSQLLGRNLYWCPSCQAG